LTVVDFIDCNLLTVVDFFVRFGYSS